MRTTNLLATFALLLAHSHAAAQIVVSSGFATSDPWTLFVFNGPLTSTAFIQGTGGNPGGYADFDLTLVNSTSSGLGFLWNGPPTLLIVGSLTTLTISADYKHFSGPAAELLPTLLQSGRAYYPVANVITLGTNPEWSPVGTYSYQISELANSSGIPFNPSAPAQLAFWARIRSPVPATVTSHIGIDNINIQIIPAPASITLPALALLLAHRRRRLASVCT